MKTAWMVGALIALGISALAAPAQNIRKTIKLRYTKPSEMLDHLRTGQPRQYQVQGMPQEMEALISAGIDLFANDLNNTLIVEGNSESVADVLLKIGLFDIQVKTVRLDIRVAVVSYDAKGLETGRERTEITTTTPNNRPVTNTVSSVRLSDQWTPRVNGDDSISISGVFRFLARDGSVRREQTVAVRLPSTHPLIEPPTFRVAFTPQGERADILGGAGARKEIEFEVAPSVLREASRR